MKKSECSQGFNYRAVEWGTFLTELIKNLEKIPEPRQIDDEDQFHKALHDLTKAIHDTIEKNVPKHKPSPHSKRWWTKELNSARSLAKRTGERVYRYRNHPTHPVHKDARRARNNYSELIKQTKDFWMDWLENINTKSVWDTNCFISMPGSDGGRMKIPMLKEKINGRVICELQDNTEKSRLLHTTFFKDPPAQEEDERTFQYPAPSFKFEPIQDSQIHRAIWKLHPYKAPGLSDVANVVLMKCADQLVPYLGPIFRATFRLCIYPETWKEFATVVLRKPSKADYTIPNAYRPIALLDVIAKVLSTCVKETLEH